MALNVTTAVFGENCNTATASPSLAQWDTEQVLQISGIDLPDSYKVEFSTVYTRNAIPEIGDASGVTIPNVLLQRSAPITAYVVLYGENGGRNREYWITIHITPGQPPETITPDPEQEDVIDQAIAALNNGVAAAEAAATSAEESASDAADHAADAEAWAVGQRAGADVPDTDPTYHNNSKYYAERAKAAAEEAGRHEASWESWARRAETAAGNAEGSATAAGQSKAAAEAAAQTATQKATEAGNSAAAAAGSAASARQTVDGAIGAINTARDGAIGAINTAGSNAVGAVEQEGTTQVNRVQTKGDEVIDSIPQDYTDLVDDVADLSRQLSDVEENQIPELTSALFNYDNYYKIGFTSNYTKSRFYAPKGNNVIVSTVDGNNFTNGSITFFDVNNNIIDNWSLPSSRNKRVITLPEDAYAAHIYETTPTNIQVSRVFAYKSITNVVNTLGTVYATLTDGVALSYTQSDFSINIGTAEIIIYINNTQITLSHEKLITDLGSSSAVEDGSGKLKIILGGNNFFVYDTEANVAKIVTYNNYNASKYVLLFSTRYNSSVGGLLTTNYTIKGLNALEKSVSEILTLEKQHYAYLSDGGKIYETAPSGIINIGACDIRVFYNGTNHKFTHADIISALGSSAEEDASGNMSIRITPEKALVFNKTTLNLQLIYLANFSAWTHILLYGCFYNSGAVGLLADENNSLVTRLNQKIAPIRLLNSSPSFIDENIDSALTAYGKNVLNAGVHNEQFLFFSDPHCMSNFEGVLLGMMSTIQKCFNSCSANYVICGGDWLGANDTLDTAAYKLGYIKGIGKSMLGGADFYNLIGNHDTNYQGTPTLTENQLRNIWYSGGKCYFKIEKDNCTYYALDTGVDNDDTLTPYRLEQLDWLCTNLISDDKSHSAILMHIVFTDSSDVTQISTMAETVGDIITAYNSQSSITVNGHNYNFVNCTGHIAFVLSGHVHVDVDATLGGVPCVAIINTNSSNNGSIASFDLCVADFDNGKLKMTRVGAGLSREFNI